MPDDEQQPSAEEPVIDDLEQKCDEAVAGWKRALADYDNLKKDLSKERAEMIKHAAWRAAQAFLPVLDNFDAALKFQPEADPPLADTPAWQKLQGWLQGILFIRAQLEKALEDLGLEPFGAVGDAFDPNMHEAVDSRAESAAPSRVIPSDSEGSRDSSPSARNDTGSEHIAEIVRRGWKLGEQVVRPAQVVVGSSV